MLTCIRRFLPRVGQPEGAVRAVGSHFLGKAIVFGCGLIVLSLIVGAWVLLERTWQTARHAADTTLLNASLIVESVVNRQLLQVDGALASLPALFATINRDGADLDPESAQRLLRGLNFQTFAFHDIILLHPAGTIWTSARANLWSRNFPLAPAELSAVARGGVAVVAGPLRNPATGEWVLLVVRQVAVPGAGTLDAVAELPVPLISKLLYAVVETPGLRVMLERRNGQLLVSQPYDERQIGKEQDVAISQIQSDGDLFMVPSHLIEPPTLGIARASLYDDVVIALTLDLATAMADWARERDRMIGSVAVGVVLLSGLATILVAALRQRENAEQNIRFAVHYDALTKLANRVLFRTQLQATLLHARPGERLALLYIDLDGFKGVNDTLGHPIGDALLQAVARRLIARTRSTDIVARLGGD